MGEEAARKIDVSLIGLSPKRFEAAVNSLVTLRDTGKLLLFLTRAATIKLIGEDEEFQQEFRLHAQDPSIDAEQAKKAQDEIRLLTSLVLRVPTTDRILNHLEEFYSDELSGDEELDPSLKEEFRVRERSKIEIVTKKLITEEMKQRARRLSTATEACVEEVDYEVVREREDSLRGRTIREPFLRVRLRYSENFIDDPLYYSFYMFSFDGPTSRSIQSFEFECDLTDIDLLLKRLSHAKKRLLENQESESESV